MWVDIFIRKVKYSELGNVAIKWSEAIYGAQYISLSTNIESPSSLDNLKAHVFAAKIYI